MFLIHHFLENSADTNPEKEAVVHGNQRFSYLEIEKKANQIANWLLTSSISKGDRVAILLKNSIEYICSYYGVLKTGGIVVPLNTGLESQELKQMLRDCSPRALITENYFSKIIHELSAKQTSPLFKFLAIADGDKIPKDIKLSNLSHDTFPTIYQNYSHSRPEVKIIDQDLSSIIYTSGSTGRPKGVMLTHLNIVTNTSSIISYLHLTQKDRCLAVLPFYYVYGKTLLNTHFMVSGTVIIDNRFTFPNAVLKTMVKEQATGFSGVPSTYSILLNKSSIAKMSFPTLRYLTQAGGHMSAEAKKRLLKIFQDKEIFIMYGASEASARLSYLDPKELPKKINSIGKPIANVALDIFNKNGETAKCGEEGEILARGSNIMIGYWNRPEDTKKVIKNGWYYTGDLGIKDEEGFFYITGRKRDMIKVGTYKVSAVEIEEILYKYPQVHEAAVIGIPDEILGESLKAFIVLNTKSNHTKEKIIQFCQKTLPIYKVPKEIVFSDTLPKNESGKILNQH